MIEVVCGCMFSGKTESLILRLRRFELAKQPILLVKPAVDVRFSKTEAVSHSGYRMDALPIAGGDPWEIVKHWIALDKQCVVGIDEAQFFEGITPVVERLSQETRVIVAGLDLDYEGRPFLDPALLSVAESVTKLSAVCVTCGDAAHRTQRLSGGTDRVEVGASEQYEARCLTHWTGTSVG